MSDSPNKTGITDDVSSLTNSAVMAVDAVMRKNGIPFGTCHAEARALLNTLITSAVADFQAQVAREHLDAVVQIAGGSE